MGVSLASYRPFFRELDVELLGVIQCGLLSRSLLDTELHSHVRHTPFSDHRVSCLAAFLALPCAASPLWV